MLNNEHCTKCRLHEHRTKVVNGKGNFASPKYFIVGEAPKKDEDLKGIPFIGGEGRVLKSMLKDANIDLSDCFLSYTCRCSPPNNRAPEIDEILACKEYLIEEIKRVNPEKLICVGDTSTMILTGKSLTQWRGMIVNSIVDKRALLTYEPKFIMKSWHMYPVVVWDLNKITRPEPEVKEPEFIYNPLPGDLKLIFDRWHEKDYIIDSDIETLGDKDDESDIKKGLNFFTDLIIGIAFYVLEENIAVQLSGVSLQRSQSLLQEFFERHKKFCYHNNLFDRAFLKMQNMNSGIAWDTRNGMHLINSSLPQKLDFLRSLYTNIEPYKNKDNYANNIAWLNCMDVYVTGTVRREQGKFIKPELMSRIMRYEDAVLSMKTRGVLVDQAKMSEHYISIKPQIDYLEEKFAKEHNIMISSTKQLAEFLYKTKGHSPSPQAKTKTGYSTDEDAVKYVIDSCIGEIPDYLTDILEYRTKAKDAGTYCEGVYRLIQKDKRLHPDWRTTGTDTGRWACKKPNMQNFPKHMRDMIIPEKGKIFFAADYAKIELMMAGILSNEYELVETLEKGYPIWDILLEEIEKVYALTANIGSTQAKLRVKAVVYGTINGRTPQDIAQEFKTSPQAVQAWLDIFYNKYPKLKEFFTITIPREFQTYGYVKSFFGRVKYASKETEARNFKIQSPAADIMGKASADLDNLNFSLIISVHDQLVSEEPDDETKEERFKLFIKTMETAAPELHHRFPVEGKMGYNWKEVS